MIKMRICILICLIAFLLSDLSYSQTPGETWRNNVSLLFKSNFGGFGAGNLWFWENDQNGRYYVLITTDRGLSIVDVTDLSNPVEVVHINHQNHIKGDSQTPNLSVDDVEIYEKNGDYYAYLGRAFYIDEDDPIVLIVHLNKAITESGFIGIDPNNLPDPKNVVVGLVFPRKFGHDFKVV